MIVIIRVLIASERSLESSHIWFQLQNWNAILSFSSSVIIVIKMKNRLECPDPECLKVYTNQKHLDRHVATVHGE